MWRGTLKYLLALGVASAVAGGLWSGRPRRPSAAGSGPAAQAAAAPAAAERRVTIDNFAFGPQVLTVAPGTRVTWVNRDDVPHTATSSDSPAAFNSRAIDTDEQFAHVFERPGTYRYFCAVHPKMTATIVVK